MFSTYKRLWALWLLTLSYLALYKCKIIIIIVVIIIIISSSSIIIIIVIVIVVIIVIMYYHYIIISISCASIYMYGMPSDFM